MDNVVGVSPGMAFASGDLDRKANVRDDAGAIAALRLNPQARAVVFVREQPVLSRVGEVLDALHAIACGRENRRDQGGGLSRAGARRRAAVRALARR